MKRLSAVACAFGAAFGLAVSASAETETIAYWPFGTNGFHDVSGNGHDLEGVEISESDAAYMVLNQGTTTNQFLKTASKLDLSGETAVTFECWCRITGRPTGVYSVVLSTPEPWVGTGGFILYNSGVYQAQMRTSTAGWHLDSTYTNDSTHVSQSLSQSNNGAEFVDGAWHHIAYVVDRSRVNDHYACRLYVDGVLQKGNGTTGGAPYTVPTLFNDYFQIGNSLSYVPGKSYFRGYVDDVRISRGVVAPADFLKYPTVGKAMRADDGKLPVVAYWPFGGKGGKDATGNGFDLTMSTNVVLKSDGCAATAWATRTAEFACSPGQTFPFSAFSKTGLTIETYVKTQSSSKILGMMLESSTAYWGSQGSFRFNYDANSSGYRTISTAFRTSAGAASSKTTEDAFGNLGDNNWRHLAVVYDPSKTGAGIVTLYVDGVPGVCTSDNANQTAFALGDLPLYFFRRANKQIGNESDACPFYGSLDDVRITAGVLTPDRFLPHRSIGSTVALYRFDRSSLADVSGNGTELVHCQAGNIGSGTATFGDGDYPASGTGLVLSGKNAGKDWIQTANPVDLTNTKGLTVEFDFVGEKPGTDSSTVYVMAASANATTAKGGFVVYRTGDALQGQFRKDASGWYNPLVFRRDMISTPDGSHRGRYVVDATTVGKVTTRLWVDGTGSSGPLQADDAFSSLGNLTLCFGHCPSYYGYASSEPCYLKGKYLRIAISDIALDPADYVLDNLVEPETKRTLAYWDFSNFDGLTVTDCSVRGGGLMFNGTSSYAVTTNLDLSALTQVTAEFFVRFGRSPSSGTLLGMGSGAGALAVASDATAGTLSGAFIPYDHLAASNGGVTNLAPFADRDWHHVALVIDRTTSGADAVRFYVDYGRTLPAGRAWDAAARLLDGAITVGADSTQSAGFFAGRIDDLRISAGALEPNEFIQTRTGGPDGISISIR